MKRPTFREITNPEKILEDVVNKLFDAARAEGLSREQTADWLECWARNMVEEHRRGCRLHAQGKECGFNFGHNALVELIEKRYAKLEEETLDAEEIEKLFREKVKE